MPRFYFHLRTAEGRENDLNGVEFSSLDEAIQDARRARGEMLIDAALEHAAAAASKTFEITDADGRVLATVPLLEVQEAQPPHNASLGAAASEDAAPAERGSDP